MGNVIKIKHGSTAPKESQLQQYELGVQNGYLFIGGNSTSSSTVCSKIKAGTADKWTTARTLQTNLASSSAVSVDGSANKTIGVTGVLPISHGGTGTGSRMTKNRLCWTDDPVNGTLSNDMIITGGHHFADKDRIMINETDEDAAPSDFSTGLYVNGVITCNNNFKCSTSNSGLFTLDSASVSYPLIYDNGANLWIGAKKGEAYHHKGKTYISTGHDGSTANTTIQLAVPTTLSSTATTYSAPTYYDVLHEGNWSSYITMPTVTDNKVKQTKSETADWRPLLCHYDTVDSYSGDPGNEQVGSAHYVPGISVQPSTKTLMVGGGIRSEDYLASKKTVECGALVLHLSSETDFSYTGYGTGAPTSLTDHKQGRVYFQYIA